MSKVAVVGSINIDLVVRAPRFTLAGETILGHASKTIPGGEATGRGTRRGATRGQRHRGAYGDERGCAAVAARLRRSWGVHE